MNAVIYARYSSHGQTEQSIEGQLHDAYAWANQQEIKIVGEYVDRALTGTKDQRPEFQRMIQDASKRQFEMVIVWKLDRFARNRYDSAIYKARLKKHGVRVVSVKEAITDSPEGIILEGLLESMAEYYSANLSQNVKRGQRETIAKGRWCGGAIPYGYKTSDGHLVPDEKTAPVVRYIFEQYAAGVPKKKIIDELNRRGLRNRQGNPITINTFRRVLHNTTYIGQFQYNGAVIPGVAEPLIDEPTFARVQEKLASAARAPGAGKAKVDYLLQGKAFCGHCGFPMVGESGRSQTGVVYCYYACANKKKNHACEKQNEKKEYVEWYVTKQTVEYLLSPARAAHVAHIVVEQYKKEFSSSRVSELEKLLSQLQREMEKLIDALITVPKSAQKSVNARMESVGAQMEDIEADLARLRIASRIQITESEVLSWIHSFTLGDPTDPAFQRRLIDTFINSVYLYNDRIIIFFNLPGTHSPSLLSHNSSNLKPSLSPCYANESTSNARLFQYLHSKCFLFKLNCSALSHSRNLAEV